MYTRWCCRGQYSVSCTYCSIRKQYSEGENAAVDVAAVTAVCLIRNLLLEPPGLELVRCLRIILTDVVRVALVQGSNVVLRQTHALLPSVHSDVILLAQIRAMQVLHHSLPVGVGRTYASRACRSDLLDRDLAWLTLPLLRGREALDLHSGSLASWVHGLVALLHELEAVLGRLVLWLTTANIFLSREEGVSTNGHRDSFDRLKDRAMRVSGDSFAERSKEEKGETVAR